MVKYPASLTGDADDCKQADGGVVGYFEKDVLSVDIFGHSSKRSAAAVHISSGHRMSGVECQAWSYAGFKGGCGGEAARSP
jgi:hypothetical protein